MESESFRVGGEFLLHAPCYYVSRLGLVESFSYRLRLGIYLFVRPCRSVGGEFLLHAPCWKLSGLSSGRESI